MGIRSGKEWEQKKADGTKNLYFANNKYNLGKRTFCIADRHGRDRIVSKCSRKKINKNIMKLRII